MEVVEEKEVVEEVVVVEEEAVEVEILGSLMLC